MVGRRLAIAGAVLVLSGSLATGAAWGSAAAPGAPRLVPQAAAWAHVVVGLDGRVQLDTSASSGVTGVSSAVPPDRPGVCIYGNFIPRAVAATADVPYAGPPAPWVAVSILSSWLTHYCPQGGAQSSNGHPSVFTGHVVGFLESPAFAPVSRPLPCPKASPGLPVTDAASQCGKGFWVVFY